METELLLSVELLRLSKTKCRHIQRSEKLREAKNTRQRLKILGSEI